MNWIYSIISATFLTSVVMLQGELPEHIKKILEAEGPVDRQRLSRDLLDYGEFNLAQEVLGKASRNDPEASPELKELHTSIHHCLPVLKSFSDAYNASIKGDWPAVDSQIADAEQKLEAVKTEDPLVRLYLESIRKRYTQAIYSAKKTFILQHAREQIDLRNFDQVKDATELLTQASDQGFKLSEKNWNRFSSSLDWRSISQQGESNIKWEQIFLEVSKQLELARFPDEYAKSHQLYNQLGTSLYSSPPEDYFDRLYRHEKLKELQTQKKKSWSESAQKTLAAIRTNPTADNLQTYNKIKQWQGGGLIDILPQELEAIEARIGARDLELSRADQDLKLAEEFTKQNNPSESAKYLTRAKNVYDKYGQQEKTSTIEALRKRNEQVMNALNQAMARKENYKKALKQAIEQGTPNLESLLSQAGDYGLSEDPLVAKGMQRVERDKVIKSIQDRFNNAKLTAQKGKFQQAIEEIEEIRKDAIDAGYNDALPIIDQALVDIRKNMILSNAQKFVAQAEQNIALNTQAGLTAANQALEYVGNQFSDTLKQHPQTDLSFKNAKNLLRRATDFQNKRKEFDDALKALGSTNNRPTAQAISSMEEIVNSLEGRASSLGEKYQESAAQARKELRNLKGMSNPPEVGPTTPLSQNPVSGQNFTVQSANNLEMIWCPPGTFMMGSPPTEKGRQPDEALHQVTLTKGFWLSKYEATYYHFEKTLIENSYGELVSVSNSKLKDGKPNMYPLKSHFGGDQYNGVSWNEALRICQQINKLESSLGRLPEGYRYSLPTEAQWEYACRAGTKTAYSFGSEVSKHKLNAESKWGLFTGHSKKNLEVGLFPANPWGFYDMHGNFGEWVWDYYSPDYPSGNSVDPMGPDFIRTEQNYDTIKDRKILRGGMLTSKFEECRSASRKPQREDLNYLWKCGFRLCLRPIQGEKPKVKPPLPVPVGPPKIAQSFSLPSAKGMGMMWCPPGTFKMGSPRTEEGHWQRLDENQHEVTLSKGFWLSEYELTGYHLGINASRKPYELTGTATSQWKEAVEWCDRINKKEMQAGRLPFGYSYSLPTEAQWEYACRAGTTTTYSFGSTLTEKNAYMGVSVSLTQPDVKAVGSYPPNDWGLYDMHGNLKEWVHDYYARNYPSGQTVDPFGPETGKIRVARGGDYLLQPEMCRSACRFPYKENLTPSEVGFRLSLSPVRSARPEKDNSGRGTLVLPP